MKIRLLLLLALLTLALGCPPDDDDTTDDDDMFDDDDTVDDDDTIDDDDSATDDDDSLGDDDSATDDDDSADDDDAVDDDDSAPDDDDTGPDDDDTGPDDDDSAPDDDDTVDDDDSAPSGAVWWLTCGDSVCSGWTPSGNPLCSGQQLGDPCAPIGDLCDPSDGCNAQYLCTLTDPQAGGCPISSARFKEGIEYLSDEEKTALAAELLRMRLARYRYSITGQPEGRRLGFIVEDQPGSPAVDGDHVDLYGYASMLVATVQAQQDELDQLRKDLEALQEQCASR